jgi:hypothetical protein
MIYFTIFFMHSPYVSKHRACPLDNRIETRMRTKLMIVRFDGSIPNYMKTFITTFLLYPQRKLNKLLIRTAYPCKLLHFWDSSSIFSSFKCSAHLSYVRIHLETWPELWGKADRSFWVCNQCLWVMMCQYSISTSSLTFGRKCDYYWLFGFTCIWKAAQQIFCTCSVSSEDSLLD